MDTGKFHVNNCECAFAFAVRCMFVLHVLFGVSGVPVTEPVTLSTSSTAVTNYLLQFGYLTPQDPKIGALISEDYVVRAIKQFQRMAGIPQTGQVDAETKKMMEMPRCGNSDNVEIGKGARRKRYALQGSKWAKLNITFRISAYPRDLPVEEVDEEISRALKIWTEVTPLRFFQKEDNNVDLEIKFARRHHGDGNPFDGRGRTLAHAFFPQFGGDAHFDDEEQWTIALSSGVNLFQVAAHEFGHSLGLSHSDTSSALMAPFYRGYQRSFKLADDDVKAIQELYGVQQNYPAIVSRPREFPPPTRGPPINIPSICNNPSIDAIVLNADGKTYIFKGEFYYRLNDYGIDDGYPRRISDDWGGLSGPVDSALHWDNGYSFLFKGDSYWKFYNLKLIYIRRISEGFKGVPADIDASFVWGGNGKTYFMKGNQYWRYTENVVDAGYPRPLSVWSGLPSRIDAAIKWRNGRTYFFSGENYYRYNDVEFNIDNSYPRKIGNWWLGCPDNKEKLGQIGDGTQGGNAGNRIRGKVQAKAQVQIIGNGGYEQFITVNDSVSTTATSDKNKSSLVHCSLTSLTLVSIFSCRYLLR